PWPRAEVLHVPRAAGAIAAIRQLAEDCDMLAPMRAPIHADRRTRCGWAKASLPIYVTYHDEEWGVPLHDERRLVEMIVLEGHQAGLSWETILKKRAAYREPFEGFNPARVAHNGARQPKRQLGDARLARNRLKME